MKDAHGPGLNTRRNCRSIVQLIRSWSGSPRWKGWTAASMPPFSWAITMQQGEGGNALSHTGGVEFSRITINGQPASEFLNLQLDGRFVGFKRAPHGRRDLRGGGRAAPGYRAGKGRRGDICGLRPVLAHRRIREGAERAVKQLVRRPYHTAGRSG